MELFSGVELVWLAWAVSLVVLVRGIVGLATTARRFPLRTLAADEAGLSYTLSYVMAIPVYLFFLCIAYESTFLLVAKVGTMYAAHAGARSAVVWQSAEPASAAEGRIAQSVRTAMAPFATSSLEHIASAGGPPPEAFVEAGEYVLAYKLYSQKSAEQPPSRWRPYAQTNAQADALARFYLCAAARTEITRTELDPDDPNGGLQVTVTYRAPMRIPGPARWLDADGVWPFEFEIRSVATLPNEAPDTPERTLGIPYRSTDR